MNRAYYADSIEGFIVKLADQIIGTLSTNSEFAVEQSQIHAWRQEISVLQQILGSYEGAIYFEYDIPRMGRRIDVVILIGPVIFVLEFKVGEKEFTSNAIDQVWDYALDLKNFHESSHEQYIAPVLIATESLDEVSLALFTPQTDKLLLPITTNAHNIKSVIDSVLGFVEGEKIDRSKWEQGRYSPTPTIIEAAMVLYNNHTVENIKRNDADAINLSQTNAAIAEIIRVSREESKKSICFVTGVPGAGKTLIGLDVATKHINKDDKLYSVFLSGNGPLVLILREALTRDKVRRAKERGYKITKGGVMNDVKMFIQNVHNFRDEYLLDTNPPIEHVALFDEAQRAWNLTKTADFMSRKKGVSGFDQSEPEFLISCLDRHSDWAVVVCLVGGGQEIHTGEAGIAEWIESLNRAFPDWEVYISPRLIDSEYAAGEALEKLKDRKSINYKEELHLSVSMRSFRAEHVSLLVKQLLDRDVIAARNTLEAVRAKYPIVLTRDLSKAKKWLREKARGSERYGIIVSSQAERLKPHAIDVKSLIDPIRWFLDGKDDVRSSYYLEDVATEFHVQGLELDWACITWDADFRIADRGWEHWSFRGKRWEQIKKRERQVYQKNAYRVLLTRARQGMVIVVPTGDADDPTRDPLFYNSTFEYLQEIGFTIL